MSPAHAPSSSRPRRSPSAIGAARDAASRTSAGAKCGRPASRNTVSTPQVPVPPARTTRSSSAKPPGRRISRRRRLRSRSPAVASLRLAAGCSARASCTHLLKSGSRASISRRRRISGAGRPFSTYSAVGSRVAGAVVIRQVPSAGTTRPSTSRTRPGAAALATRRAYSGPVEPSQEPGIQPRRRHLACWTGCWHPSGPRTGRHERNAIHDALHPCRPGRLSRWRPSGST